MKELKRDGKIWEEFEKDRKIEIEKIKRQETIERDRKRQKEIEICLKRVNK